MRKPAKAVKFDPVYLLDDALEIQERFEELIKLPEIQRTRKLKKMMERVNDDLAEVYQEIGRRFA